jgi:CDP-paratose 2-epimerase
MKCVVTGTPYTVFGYQGKQVRDNIHAEDLVRAFFEFYKQPRSGEVYNIGGARENNCSMLEAIALCEEIAGKKLRWNYEEANRIGDHIWWVSDTRKFRQQYPAWSCRNDLRSILSQIYEHSRQQSKQTNVETMEQLN